MRAITCHPQHALGQPYHHICNCRLSQRCTPACHSTTHGYSSRDPVRLRGCGRSWKTPVVAPPTWPLQRLPAMWMAAAIGSRKVLTHCLAIPGGTLWLKSALRPCRYLQKTHDRYSPDAAIVITVMSRYWLRRRSRAGFHEPPWITTMGSTKSNRPAGLYLDMRKVNKIRRKARIPVTGRIHKSLPNCPQAFGTLSVVHLPWSGTPRRKVPALPCFRGWSAA